MEYEHSLRHLDRLQQIIGCIEANYNRRIRVRDIAAMLGYSEDYLSRMFRRQTGIGIVDYLYEIRIGHVYNDLIGSDRPSERFLSATAASTVNWQSGCSVSGMGLHRVNCGGNTKNVRPQNKNTPEVILPACFSETGKNQSCFSNMSLPTPHRGQT